MDLVVILIVMLVVLMEFVIGAFKMMEGVWHVMLIIMVQIVKFVLVMELIALMDLRVMVIVNTVLQDLMDLPVFLVIHLVENVGKVITIMELLNPVMQIIMVQLAKPVIV